MAEKEEAAASTAMTPIAQPTPIPALAPELRPEEPDLDPLAVGAVEGEPVTGTLFEALPEAAASDNAGVEIVIEGVGMPLVNGTSPPANDEPVNSGTGGVALGLGDLVVSLGLRTLSSISMAESLMFSRYILVDDVHYTIRH